MLMIFDPVIPYLHIYLKEMISMNKKETDTKIFFAVCVCASSVVFNSLQPHVVGGPGSSVHGIFQARILERVAIFCFRGSLQPRDWTRVSWNSRVAGSYFTAEPLAKPSLQYYSKKSEAT